MQIRVNVAATAQHFTHATRAAAAARSVLAGDGSTPVKSTIELRSWIGVERVAKCKVFRSESRDRALQLCGWATDEATQNGLLDVLEKEGNHARAAAVAVFQLTLRRAIQILRRSQDPQLKVSQRAGRPRSAGLLPRLKWDWVGLMNGQGSLMVAHLGNGGM